MERCRKIERGRDREMYKDRKGEIEKVRSEG